MSILEQRITELEEENKILLDCLNGSTKATYTADMYDKEMIRIATKCAVIASTICGAEETVNAICQEFKLPKLPKLSTSVARGQELL